MNELATLSLRGEPLPLPREAPHTPAGPSPLRRPGSVRRTSSIYLHWPQGRDERVHLLGCARDIATRLIGGAPEVLAEDSMYALADGRVIWSITADPPRVGLGGLDGVRAGGHLREAINRALPQERIANTPLYLLLDDMAGTTLIAGWAWSQWGAREATEIQQSKRADRLSQMEGVCIGFRPGSSALDLEGRYALGPDATPVPPIEHIEDPQGWHSLPQLDGPNMRRLRRIDVWRESGLIQIDATFQDSAALPQGGRMCLHEYVIRATADAHAGTLLTLEADPRTLPYPECPAATVNMHALVGTPLAEMRVTVPALLRKTAGCTHLNDALRALADVPRLAAALPAEVR